MTTLEVLDVRKRWPSAGVDALSEVTIQVARGEKVYIVGANGSGKTTLLKIISGILQPDGGQIVLCGVNVTRSPAEARAARIAHVLQDPSLGFNPEQTVLEHVLLAKGSSDDIPFFFPKYRLRKELEAYLRVLGLAAAERIGNPVWTLSGGERQALAVAMNLWRRPEVLLLDECKKELDEQARRQVDSLIDRVAEEVCPAMIVVTHDYEEALGRADRIIILAGGRIVAQISRQEAAGSIPSAGSRNGRWSMDYLREQLWAAEWSQGGAHERQGGRA